MLYFNHINPFHRYSIYQIHNPNTSDYYFELISTHTFSYFAKLNATKAEIKLDTPYIYIIPAYTKPEFAFKQFIKSEN